MRLDERLMREAKALAAAEGMSFTALIEDSLRQRLDRSQTGGDREPAILPVSNRHGGLVAGLEPEVLTDNSRLADVMDGIDDPA